MSEDFRSPLAPEMASFVAYKRARGYVYRRAAATLKSFDRYIDANSESQTARSLPNLLRQWLCSRSHRKSVSVAVELGTIRQFLRYRLRFDEDGFVPGREWAPQSVESKFVPEVVSEDQIQALLAEADCLRCDLHARPAMRALILILYVQARISWTDRKPHGIRKKPKRQTASGTGALPQTPGFLEA